jgi:hypothetical protein
MADADWLDTSPDVEPESDWLDIKDANEGKVTLAFQNLVDACMRGTNRVMACDGHYMAYRPFNREFDKEVNPRTRERFADFCAAGHYRHVGTYDEVQIYELLEGSPFLHKNKGYVVGQDYWKDIRTAAKLAIDRNWPEYHDMLGVMATALKSGRDPIFARTMWDDTINQVAISIQQMGGAAAPTEKEINEGFTGVRKARGISKGGVIATLNSNALQKVGFTK